MSVNDAVRDELERRGDSILDEERYRNGRWEVSRGTPGWHRGQIGISRGGMTIWLKLDAAEGLARDILAEAEIIRREADGEFNGRGPGG